MPCACWLGRWYVLLPPEADLWPDAMRWSVLAHELGHIQRADPWWDLVAGLSCRLGWVQPLVWSAASLLRHQRELACDDGFHAETRGGVAAQERKKAARSFEVDRAAVDSLTRPHSG